MCVRELAADPYSATIIAVLIFLTIFFHGSLVLAFSVGLFLARQGIYADGHYQI